MKIHNEFEFLTEDKKVIKWTGNTWQEAAHSCAEAKQVVIIAWRYPRYELLVCIPSIKE